MDEQRRARFEALDLIGPDDLELACEIWLDEIVHAPWSSKELMKCGAYLVRYILAPDTTQLTLSALEAIVQLTKEDVRRSLAAMQSFRAITAFTMERDGVIVAMRMSLLQQIRVLETRAKLDKLAAERGAALSALAQKAWAPPAVVSEAGAAPEPKAA